MEEVKQQPLPNQWENDIKVTLNGGGDTLDCAIVPFTFGFSPALIEKKPTHVLVIDRTQSEVDSEQLWRTDDYKYTRYGRRYIIDLSNASPFIEFYKSGNHNLLFLFFNWSHKSNKDVAYVKDMFTTKKRSIYCFDANMYAYTIIENKNLPDYVGFCEKDISIPAEFFSQKPESTVGKAFYSWVNMWRRDAPMDDCDFRDRTLRALTYELVPRLLYLLGRYVLWYILIFVIGMLISAIGGIVWAVALLSGYQITGLLQLNKLLWKDVYHGKISDWTNEDPSKIQPYKQYVIGGKIYNTPITILGAAVLLFFCWDLTVAIDRHGILSGFTIFDVSWIILQLRFIIEHTKFAERYRHIYSGKGYWLLKKTREIWIPFTVEYEYDNLLVICLAVIGSLWLIIGASGLLGILTNHGKQLLEAFGVVCVTAAVILFLGWKLEKPISKWLNALMAKRTAKEKVKAKEEEKEPAVDEYKAWLSRSYSIDAFPKTIAAADLPKAQTKTKRVKQIIRTTFMATKAKICKPYEH